MSLRIRSLSEEPIHQIGYLQARAGGGTERVSLPILLGAIEGLPPSLDAIVCAGDLQGVTEEAEPRLLGELLAQELTLVLEILALSPVRTGIVLAGDLYSAPEADRRGASGDVRPVWDAFQKRYAWVAGVLGNHDRLDSAPDAANVHLLDGDTCPVDGLTLAGIGGIIGNPAKLLRRSPGDYLSTLDRLNRKRPDLMILHPSPAIEALALRGDEDLGAAYRRQSYPLTVCGHIYWPSPLVEGDNVNQLLNVDSRAVVLRRE